MRKLIAVLGVTALLAPEAAVAAGHYIKVSPATVKAGKRIRVYGNVDGGCAVGGGNVATIYSHAFAGSTTKEFAGVPAVYPRTNKHGGFSFLIRIKAGSVKKGKYHIGGRCGGGNFGSATVKVT